MHEGMHEHDLCRVHMIERKLCSWQCCVVLGLTQLDVSHRQAMAVVCGEGHFHSVINIEPAYSKRGVSNLSLIVCVCVCV